MAKQKFSATRTGGFSGVKAYIEYAEVLKKHRNAVGQTFCDAIKIDKPLPEWSNAGHFTGQGG